MKRVAFVNENTLGHASYILPYVEELQRRQELGIEPQVINATPLPPGSARWAASVRGLRRYGLDFSGTRWRLVASRHVRDQLDGLITRTAIDAVVVNTQSVALGLIDLPESIPLHISLDATFSQLAASGWFAPNAPSGWFLPLTMGGLRRRERALFDSAFRLLPWSRAAQRSLREEYRISDSKIQRLPPSVSLSTRPERPRNARPRILFIGGNFYRKGGAMLLSCFQEHLAKTCELHVVTQTDVQPSENVYVYRCVNPNDPIWKEQWQKADVFVFPSLLETFGIVLLEALAHSVPVVSTDVGAAREILDDGRCGVLIEKPDHNALAEAIQTVLEDTDGTSKRVQEGQRRIMEDFDLAKNVESLAARL